MLLRYSAHQEHQLTLGELNAKMLVRLSAEDPRAMKLILDEMIDRRGSVRRYVRAIGITDGSLTELERDVSMTQ